MVKIISLILLVPGVIVLAIILTFGVLDLYMAYRFGRHPKVDSTAAILNWLKLKWLMVSQTDQFAERNEFITQDLSEQVGYPEDGRVT